MRLCCKSYLQWCLFFLLVARMVDHKANPTSVPAEESSSMSPSSGSKPSNWVEAHLKSTGNSREAWGVIGRWKSPPWSLSYWGETQERTGGPQLLQLPCVMPRSMSYLASTCLRKAETKPHICLFTWNSEAEKTHIPLKNWLKKKKNQQLVQHWAWNYKAMFSWIKVT